MRSIAGLGDRQRRTLGLDAFDFEVVAAAEKILTRMRDADARAFCEGVRVVCVVGDLSEKMVARALVDAVNGIGCGRL